MKRKPTYCAQCNQVKVTPQSFAISYRSPIDGLKVFRFCKHCTENFAERYLLLTNKGHINLRKIYAIWRKR